MDDSTGVVLDPVLADRARPTSRPAGIRQDLYLLAYGRDYKAALADAASIFGRQPLVPRYALGYWYSRYWAYTDKEIEELVQQFDQFDVPIDVMVIDMDWHKIGWTGTSWDRDYFPRPSGNPCLAASTWGQDLTQSAPCRRGPVNMRMPSARCRLFLAQPRFSISRTNMA